MGSASVVEWEVTKWKAIGYTGGTPKESKHLFDNQTTSHPRNEHQGLYPNPSCLYTDSVTTHRPFGIFTK